MELSLIWPCHEVCVCVCGYACICLCVSLSVRMCVCLCAPACSCVRMCVCASTYVLSYVFPLKNAAPQRRYGPSYDAHSPGISSKCCLHVKCPQWQGSHRQWNGALPHYGAEQQKAGHGLQNQERPACVRTCVCICVFYV
jgi:hypothetical protein